MIAFKDCRDTRIRTWDPLLPKQVRYRTALHPESKNKARLRGLADGAGFEPAVRVSPYVGLANRWFQPLTHPSVGCFIEADAKLRLRFLFAKYLSASFLPAGYFSPDRTDKPCSRHSLRLILSLRSSSATVSLKIRSVSIISCTALQE